MALYLCPEGTKEGDDSCNQTNAQLLCDERPVYKPTNQLEFSLTHLNIQFSWSACQSYSAVQSQSMHDTAGLRWYWANRPS